MRHTQRTLSLYISEEEPAKYFTYISFIQIFLLLLGCFALSLSTSNLALTHMVLTHAAVTGFDFFFVRSTILGRLRVCMYVQCSYVAYRREHNNDVYQF